MNRTAICLLVLPLVAQQDYQSTRTPEVHQVFASRLPAMRGDSLRTEILEVTYGPGESSRPHRHSCAVVGYVLQGALRTQMAGGTGRVVHAGQAFYEAPLALHQVSANASTTAPARFLAIFTCDRAGALSRGQNDPARKEPGS